jgi:hypothetical protein
MKKIILTIVQLLVTGALLYWVFHNPALTIRAWFTTSAAPSS